MYSKRKGDIYMKKILGLFVCLLIIMLSFSSYAEMDGEKMTEYKNVVETEASSYFRDSNGNAGEFGFNVPLKIHYNNEYKTYAGCPIVVNEFVIVDGTPVFKITIDADRGVDRASYKIVMRCHTSDSEYTDIEEEGISCILRNGVFHVEDEPLSGLKAEDFFKKNTVQSIEVWIDEYDYSKK